MKTEFVHSALQVDDEIHFLIHCKADDALRTTILPDLRPPPPPCQTQWTHQTQLYLLK